jgi:methylase of polypeptide subunit release factors
MDLHHEIVFRLLDEALHKAPIVNNPQRILDVGTGTGIWAIDMADKHTSAEVLGIDLRSVAWCERSSDRRDADCIVCAQPASTEMVCMIGYNTVDSS